MAGITRKKAQRDYSIDGLGSPSKSFETRQVRSAVVQAVRDTINESWEIPEESIGKKIIVTVRVVVMPGGVRRVTAEALIRDEWVENFEEIEAKDD